MAANFLLLPEMKHLFKICLNVAFRFGFLFSWQIVHLWAILLHGKPSKSVVFILILLGYLL